MKRSIVGDLDGLLKKAPKLIGMGKGTSSVVRGKPKNVLTQMGLLSIFPKGRMFPKTRR